MDGKVREVSIKTAIARVFWKHTFQSFPRGTLSLLKFKLLLHEPIPALKKS